MKFKRRSITLGFVSLFLIWNGVTYHFLSTKSSVKDSDDSDIAARIGKLESQLKEQVHQREFLVNTLHRLLQSLEHKVQHEQLHAEENVQQPPEEQVVHGAKPAIKSVIPNIKLDSIQSDVKQPKPQAGDKVVIDKQQPGNVDPSQVVLPILVIACNRPTIKTNLDEIIRYRPSEKRFPIIVSQDCGHAPTASVIQSYGDQVTHIKHPDLSDIALPPKEKKYQGYYKIARHYKWALNQVFHYFNHSAVIIVEDDLNLSEDFFEYFAATFPILHADPSLWCVSAWNDNGKSNMISDDSELLYRTDFFPGLGWMMERKTWLELEPKWPDTFWDDWMRHPDQRKEKSCIRPEISRTNTFGKIGVSKGQFYEKHLKFIKLNDNFVPFTKTDLSYLLKENYDAAFAHTVYNAPLFTVPQVLGNESPETQAVRVQYNDRNQFKLFAKQLGIMDDVKSGIPRAGYRGVVSFSRNSRRVYLAPPPSWTKYDPTWS